MGHPGTLPALNKEAARAALRIGRALGGTLARYSEFDRKHYFYPDIPKGYQISQYAYPLVRGGALCGVAVTRVHLEEDTARSLHESRAGSVIDFNRAGVPLMELVTEPVMHDAKVARIFARELQLLLRALGASDANMERGEMRVEVNISLSQSDALGTKVEIKNLNSFRAVAGAIAYEIERQSTLLGGGEPVVQETRGWDEVRGETFPQREKESSHDYRYFPDPDVPKVEVSKVPEFVLSRLDEIIQEIPSKKRERFEKLGLTSNTVVVLVSNPLAADFFDASLRELAGLKTDLTDEDRQITANYLTSDVLGYLGEHTDASFASASAVAFGTLMHMLIRGSINSRVAKDLLPEAVFGGKDPAGLARARGLLRVDSREDLVAVVERVLTGNPEAVSAYRSGKEASLQFLIGACMKETRGRANPALVNTLLIERLGTCSATRRDIY